MASKPTPPPKPNYKTSLTLPLTLAEPNPTPKLTLTPRKSKKDISGGSALGDNVRIPILWMGIFL